eukprot:765491-Hanusia_phi.AAC.2
MIEVTRARSDLRPSKLHGGRETVVLDGKAIPHIVDLHPTSKTSPSVSSFLKVDGLGDFESSQFVGLAGRDKVIHDLLLHLRCALGIKLGEADGAAVREQGGCARAGRERKGTKTRSEMGGREIGARRKKHLGYLRLCNDIRKADLAPVVPLPSLLLGVFLRRG